MTADDHGNDVREYLDCQVDAWTWGAFVEEVRREFPSLDPYLGIETENALKQWLDVDALAEAEDALRVALEDLDDTDTGAADVTDTVTHSNPTVRAQVKVDADVLQELRATVDQLDGIRFVGTAVARAVREYMLNPREDRVLAYAQDLAEAAQADEDDGIPTTQAGKAELIAENLGDMFTDEDLDEEIGRIAGQGDGPHASDPTIRTYRPLVLDETGYVAHPNNPDVWVPPAVAEEYAPDGIPEVCRRRVDRLDKGERTDRVLLEVALRAAQGTGVSVADRDTVREEFLNDEVTNETATSYIDAAASTTKGVERVRVGNRPGIRVDLEYARDAGESDLVATAVRYREALKEEARDTTLGEFAPDAAANDPAPEVASDGGAEADTDAEFDRILGEEGRE